jgi:hypothetical protein
MSLSSGYQNRLRQAKRIDAVAFNVLAYQTVGNCNLKARQRMDLVFIGSLDNFFQSSPPKNFVVLAIRTPHVCPLGIGAEIAQGIQG